MAEKVYKWLSITIILALVITSLVPLLYVLATSLVTEKEYLAKGGFILWPSEPTLLAYKRLFNGSLFTDALMVSVIRTALGTVLTLATTTMLAYIVSRKSMPGRKPVLFAVLITILFNGGLIPTYLVVRDLHLLDSVWALVIPGLVDSWSVLVLKQFFENLPAEMEESAKIDGAGEIRLMTSIMIPMALPAMAAIGLFTAVGQWNAWVDAMIYLHNTKLYPLQLLISNMFSSSALTSMGNTAQNAGLLNMQNRVSTETLKMALVVFGTVPILCVYPFLQKYFTKGMYLGAVKG